MLETTVGTIKMENPLILASGIWGLTKNTMERCTNIGGIVTKSIGVEERSGYKNPIFHDLEYGILNSVGLSNPGIEEYVNEIKEIKIGNLFGSIFGRNEEEFYYLAQQFSPYVKAIELNLSCPHASNVGAEYPTDNIALTIERVKETKNCIFAKFGLENIQSRAAIAVENGADVIVAINSIKAMAINIETGTPILGNKIGGYSGKGIKPIGIRCVFELASNYNIPIIGVGGIMDANDVIEYMMAGATAVQIGTAVYIRGKNIFNVISSDLETWLDKNGYSDIKDIIGISLKK